jgi:hypothetical protein
VSVGARSIRTVDRGGSGLHQLDGWVRGDRRSTSQFIVDRLAASSEGSADPFLESVGVADDQRLIEFQLEMTGNAQAVVIRQPELFG